MKTIYVTKKSYLTALMETAAVAGYTTYRVRTKCRCKAHNKRSGVLVLKDNQVIETIIRCNACTQV